MKIPLNTIDLAQTIEEWRPLTKVENDNDQVSGEALRTRLSCRVCLSPSVCPSFCLLGGLLLALVDRQGHTRRPSKHTSAQTDTQRHARSPSASGPPKCSLQTSLIQLGHLCARGPVDALAGF